MFIVILFFCGSTLIFNGNLQFAFIGAGGIIFEMLLISVSIELIIKALKDTKGIGDYSATCEKLEKPRSVTV